MEIQIHIFNEREGTPDHSETAVWLPFILVSIHVLASISPRGSHQIVGSCSLSSFISRRVMISEKGKGAHELRRLPPLLSRTSFLECIQAHSISQIIINHSFGVITHLRPRPRRQQDR